MAPAGGGRALRGCGLQADGGRPSCRPARRLAGSGGWKRSPGQAQAGWGAKVVARLAQDLRAAFTEMHGFSPRKLNYMRAFAQAWPDAEFVQAVLAQLPWYHPLALSGVGHGGH